MSEELTQSYIDFIRAACHASANDANECADALFAEVTRMQRKDWEPRQVEDTNIIELVPGTVPQ